MPDEFDQILPGDEPSDGGDWFSGISSTIGGGLSSLAGGFGSGIASNLGGGLLGGVLGGGSKSGGGLLGSGLNLPGLSGGAGGSAYGGAQTVGDTISGNTYGGFAWVNTLAKKQPAILAVILLGGLGLIALLFITWKRGPTRRSSTKT